MPDNVGNDLNSALGINISPTVNTFNDSVEFGDQDYYRFSLGGSRSVSLTLAGLGANADLELRNSSGSIVTVSGIPQTSTNEGTLPDVINTILPAGVYYIRVIPGPPTNPAAPSTTTPSTNYQLSVISESNQFSDIFWRNYNTGDNFFWRTNGSTVVGTDAVLNPGAAWVAQGLGDFNADGNPDIVWRSVSGPTIGQNIVWFMDGGNIIGGGELPTLESQVWQIQTVADFNVDGQPDLLWRNSVTQELVAWYINNGTLTGGGPINSSRPSEWLIQGSGDFNSDGRADLLWRNQVTGENDIWFLNGINFLGNAALPAVPLGWDMQGSGDFNRDGQSDILWRNFADGSNLIWLMNGASVISTAPLPSAVGDGWRALSPGTRTVQPVLRDLAGNAPTTPFSLGLLNGSGQYRDTAGAGDVDYYQFTLRNRAVFSLTLDELQADLDVRLFSNFFDQTANSSQGAGAEVINPPTELNPGTYYIQVFGTAASPYRLSFTVNNLPQLVSNNGLTVSEGVSRAIDATLLLVTDADDGPDQITYTVAPAPNTLQNGSLSLNGAAIGAGSIFTQADIIGNRLTYRHNGSETLTDSFVFAVNDGSGGTIGNTSFSISVLPVNDPPTQTLNNPLTLSEGTRLAIDSTLLLATDVEQAGAELIYSLNTLPVNGALSLNGVALTVGSTFTQAALTNPSSLSYSHNGTETLSDSFVFTLTDGAGGTANPAPSTFSIAVTPVNDAPVLLSNTGLTVTEGTSPIITNSLLRTSDAELTGPVASPQLPDQILYTIVAGPTRGTLFLGNGPLGGGNPVNAIFTQADIDNNRLIYSHDGSKSNSDSFVFRVSDGTVANVSSDATFNIIVSPLNSPPIVSLNTGLTVNEGATAAITPAELLITDPDNPAPQITYTLSQLPQNGNLRLSGTILAAGQTFTQQDINNLSAGNPASRLTYQHNGSETIADSFVFTATDPAGTIPVPPQTFSITVNPINDAPVLLSNTGLTLSEGSTADITTTLLSATDVDNLDSQITYVLEPATPGRGTLLLANTPITSGGSFTEADIRSGQLKYVHDGSESVSDNLVFRITDNQPNTPVGTLRTLNISVLPVNDAPGISVNQPVTVDEGGAITIGQATLQITDNDGPGPLTYTIGTAPAAGSLTRNGTLLAAGQTFTQDDISRNAIIYTHSGSETTADTFTFTASDNATGVLPLTTFSIGVTPINDAPVITVPAAQTVDEDRSLAFSSTNSNRITVSDPDIGSNPLTVTLAASLGSLTIGSAGGVQVTNNGQSSVTLIGNQAGVNTALNSLVYQGQPNANGPDTLTITADDGGQTGNPGQPALVRTVDITVNSINDAPTLTAPTNITLNEDATFAFTGANLVDATDVDSAASPVSVTLTAAQGRLTLASLANLTFTNGTTNGSANLTFTGPIADVRTALNSLSYQGNPDYFGTDTIVVTLDDQGATGAPGPLNVSRTISVNVLSVNDAPTFVAGVSPVINEDAGPQTVANWATSISAGAANESTQGLTFQVTNDNPTLFTVAPRIDSASGNLVYTAAPNANGVANVTVVLQDNGGTTNGGVDSSSATVFTITVNPVNDQPTFTPGGNVTITEDAGAQTVAGWARSITVGPADELATQAPTFLVTTDNPTLFLAPPVINPTTGDLTFTAAADANGRAIVTVALQDNGGTTNGGVDTSPSQTFTINVTAVNDAPTLTVPAAQVVDEDNTVNIAGISVADVDAGTGSIRATLTVASGRIGLGSTNGLTFTAGGNNTGNMVFTGTLENVNAALNNLTYQGNANFSGADTLTVSISDQGNTGSGPIGVDTDTIAITVNAINDAPIVTVPGSRTVAEDTNLTLSGISVTDLDAGNSPVQLTLSALNGRLRLVNTTNLTLVAGNNDSGSFTYEGTQAAIRTALAGSNLIYRGNQDFNGTDTVTVTLDDRSAVGAGGPLSDTETIQITVTPENDRPVLTVPGAQQVDEDVELVFDSTRAISVVDVDAGNSPIRVTLTVTRGTINLATTNDLTLVSGANNSSTVTYQGTVDSINAALANLVYRGNQNVNGADTLTINVRDLNNTGAGPEGVDNQTIAITVNAVNDQPQLLSNNTLSVSENGTRTITNSLLLTTDVDNASNQITYTLVTAPNPLTTGSLRLDGNVLQAGSTFTQEAINQNRLTYVQNGSETLTDQFVFQVRDPAPSGPAAATFNIVVNPVNDAPSLTANLGLTVNEGTTATTATTITSARLSVSDPDNTPSELRYTLRSGPANGNLRLSGSNLAVNQTFTQQDILSNRLSYRHDGSETTSDSFTFVVNDSAGGGTGVQLFTINVLPVDDRPVITTAGPATVNENGIVTINSGVLNVSDPDNSATEIIYTVANTPLNGILRRGGVALQSNQTFTQQDLTSGLITYQHDGSETTTDAFIFRVTSGNAAFGTVTLSDRFFNINVTPVNDPPQLLANTGLVVTIGAAGPYEINNSQLQVADLDTTDAQLTYTVLSAPSPQVGSLILNGTTTLNTGGTFTQADINQGNLVYLYSGLGSTEDSFRFQVSDGGTDGALSPAFFYIDFVTP